MTNTITTREIKPADWDALEELFGAKGACGGCWCMVWRSPYAGKAWRERLGEPNRRDLQSLLQSGALHAALAFDAEMPVGWCSVGPRADFPGLQRSRVLKTEWDERTWSVTCFVVKRTHRGRGVSGALLREAIRIAKKRGAKVIEGYPAKVNPEKPKLPAVFAWTGVPAIFEGAGFTCITPPDARPIYRLEV